jgi:hypothetical protein
VIRRRTGGIVAATIAGAMSVTACGATTVDTSVTAPPSDSAATMPAPEAVDTDAPLATLVLALQEEFRGLDEQIVAGDGDEVTLAQIDALWDVAEPRVQDDHPQLLFGFQQAVALARTGVERRRPADASKGELLLGPLVDELVAVEGAGS